jgi:dTMP kinase
MIPPPTAPGAEPAMARPLAPAPRLSGFHAGYLIAVEGIDGTGKSTLCSALGEWLAARDIDHTLSREPTDGPFGRRIREIARGDRDGTTLEEELRLFVEDRKQHVADVILPNLRAGRVVVLDRYFYSTIAYQGARGADASSILDLHRPFAPLPDLLVILRLDVPAALHRIRHARGSAPDAFEGEAYLKRVAALFDAIEHPNLLRLDADASTADLVETIAERASGQWTAAT